MVDYISYLTNPSSDRLILTTKLWLGRQEWIQKSWKVEGNCHVAVSRWLFRIRMNWIISVLSRRYFVFLFIWNLKYWDNNNVSYIKIDLFFRYPQLVLSSLPTDLVNAKYIHILLKIWIGSLFGSPPDISFLETSVCPGPRE